MVILLYIVAVVYILWVLSLISMGDYKSIIPFTVVFVLTPIALGFLAIACPLAVIFSKGARAEAMKRMSGEE